LNSLRNDINLKVRNLILGQASKQINERFKKNEVLRTLTQG
jgi:hypothetical protein